MLPYRTIIAIVHDDPHESLPIFGLLMNRSVTVLRTEEIDGDHMMRREPEPQPAISHRQRLIGRQPSADERRAAPPKKAYAARMEMWRNWGFVTKLHQSNIIIDVPATCAHLGIKMDQLKAGRFKNGTPEQVLWRSMLRQEQAEKRRRARQLKSVG